MEQRQRKTENDKWYKGSERQKMTNGTKAEKDRKSQMEQRQRETSRSRKRQAKTDRDRKIQIEAIQGTDTNKDRDIHK